MKPDSSTDRLLDELIGNDNTHQTENTTLSSSETDSYEDGDFLDDLMSDMGASVEKASEPVINEKPKEVEVVSSVVEKTPELPKPKKRKTPMFAQLPSNPTVKKEEVEVEKKESLVESKEVEKPVIKKTEKKTEKKAPLFVQDNNKKEIVKTSFDDMLAEEMSGSSVDSLLNEMDGVGNIPLSEQTEAIVPLDTPDMSQVKVTPDGRTLAEMLPGLRGGNRSLNQVLDDIKNEDKDIVVNGKKRSDSRYVKHAIAIENIRDEQEERKALSKKFLQKNAKYTEEEKIIMSNLGITNQQFAKLMEKGRLTDEQRGEVLSAGKYGPERHFKGRKYRTTVGDFAILEYLAKFKFANARILRWLRDEPQGRTRRKLNRLKENGLVENKSVIGLAELWGNTSAGNAVAGYHFKPALYKMPKMVSISATMGPNYLAACLWFNTVNVLNLDDFPAHNRVISNQEDGRNRVRGEMLVSELEIRSSLGKEINPEVSTMYAGQRGALYDVIASNVRSSVAAWERGGKQGEGPETELGNEYMWVLYPQNALTRHYHVPDLVVKRDRGPNGEPKSIAVEVERYTKGNNNYKQIMLAYKLDKHLYEKVVWVTPNSSVVRQLQQAAEEIGFDRYDIVPIITKDGTYDKTDIWMI